jgi:hypothetical protein
MCSSLANAIHLGTYAALAAPRVTIFDLRRVPRGLLPRLTPILQTLALTPELLAAFPHSSATLRTNTIQNAGGLNSPINAQSLFPFPVNPSALRLLMFDPKPGMRASPTRRDKRKDDESQLTPHMPRFAARFEIALLRRLLLTGGCAINVWRVTFVCDVSDRVGGWKTQGCGVECSTTPTYVRNDKQFVFCFGKIIQAR